MKLFYVYKENYCQYSENKGSIVMAVSWQQAKGIAMADWKNQARSNVKVHEIEIEEGIICYTDYIVNKKELDAC